MFSCTIVSGLLKAEFVFSVCAMQDKQQKEKETRDYLKLAQYLTYIYSRGWDV